MVSEWGGKMYFIYLPTLTEASTGTELKDYLWFPREFVMSATTKLKQLKPKIVFNALHGKYGEDGFVQSILESLKIPYTHSGVLSSSLAMDKELSRLIFIKNNLKVPKYFLLYKGYEKNLNKKIKNSGIKIAKIPSGEIINLPYLKAVAKLFENVIMSTGMLKVEGSKVVDANGQTVVLRGVIIVPSGGLKLIANKFSRQP